MDFVLLFFNERTYSNKSVKSQLSGLFQHVILFAYLVCFIA